MTSPENDETTSPEGDEPEPPLAGRRPRRRFRAALPLRRRHDRRRAGRAVRRPRARHRDRRARHRRRPAHALRREQGKLAFGTLARLQRPHPALRPRQRRRPTSTQFTKLTLGDWIGVDGEVMTTRRGELSVQVDEWTLLAETRRAVPRQVARHHRHRHPLPPALRRPVGHRRGAPRVPAASADDVAHPALCSRTAGFVEVETPVFHPIPGGAPGPALRHAPQRARHGAVPADRARAVPEAARRRRVREGVRDRPGVPQRGHCRPGTTPSSRCSSSTRPTPTTTCTWS